MSGETLSDMMGMLSAQGWGGIDVDPNQFGADQKKFMEDAAAEASPIAELFSTEDGKRALAWLMAKTILKPPSAEDLTIKTAEEYAIFMARKQGQNGVIFMILYALQVAHGERVATGDEI